MSTFDPTAPRLADLVGQEIELNLIAQADATRTVLAAIEPAGIWISFQGFQVAIEVSGGPEDAGQSIEVPPRTEFVPFAAVASIRPVAPQSGRAAPGSYARTP